MEIRFNGHIYIFISNPLNKIYIEKALEGIQFEKTYDEENRSTRYEIKNTKKYAIKFLDNASRMVRENNEVFLFCYETDPKKKKVKHLILFDGEAYKGKKGVIPIDNAF